MTEEDSHAACLRVLRTTRPGASRDEASVKVVMQWSRRFGVFPETLDLQALRALCQSLSVRTAHRGDVLFVQGDAPRCYHILHAGLVRLTQQRRRTESLREVQPGQGFGEEAFLRHRRRHATSAVVVSPQCEVLEVPSAVYDATLAAEHRATLERLEIERFFRQTGVLRGIDPAVVSARRLRKGEVLCRRAAPATHVFVVAAGEFVLEATVEQQKGGSPRGFQVARCGAGALIGDLEALEACVSHLTTARAADDRCVAYAVPRDHFRLDARAEADLKRRQHLRRHFHAKRALAELRGHRRTASAANQNVPPPLLARHDGFSSRSSSSSSKRRPVTADAKKIPSWSSLSAKKNISHFSTEAGTARMEAADRALLALHRMPPKQRAATPTTRLRQLVGDALWPYIVDLEQQTADDLDDNDDDGKQKPRHPREEARRPHTTTSLRNLR